jgi:HMG box factor, other
MPMLLMSYDRVLPKPAALYNESAGNRIPRQTTSLLEHKIMNDQSATPKVAGRSNGVSVGRIDHYLTDSDSRSPGLVQTHLSSMNREQVARNEMSSSILTVNNPVITLSGEEEIHAREQSASSCSSQSDPPKEQAAQFCLCQPDPKIPRPRNGT